MSETKHTPGPWESIRTLAPRGWVVTANDGAYDIAVVRDGSGMEENERNARLIASAPDLLEALTTGAQLNMPDFLEWIAARLVNVHGEDPNVDFVQTLRSRAKLCREAIAKATESNPAD